jgi:hypothetical protein
VKLSIDNTHGTGFFVAAGLILTCHHVVKSAGDRPIKVRWQNQEDFAVATVLQSFPDPVDLALLQFETVEALACVELDGAIAAFDNLFAYGYPDIDPNGAGVVLRCDGLNGDVPPKIKFSDGRVRSGLSGAPLLNPATGKVCGIVKYTEDRSLPLGGGGIPIATVLEYFPVLNTPYKGLAYFKDDDARFFFGRTALTDLLLDRLQQSNFLALLGASGSGKSSVLRAGLLNQLRQGRLSGSDRWELRVMLPTEHPLKSLANEFVDQKLGNIDSAAQLATAEKLLSEGKDGLRRLVEATAKATRMVLVIDQFEESFTLCQNLEEREQFFACLIGALDIATDKFCLAIAMRADFFGKCVEREYGGLSKRIAAHLVVVTPMNDDELREAIAKPAAIVGCEVEPILIEEIVRDVAGAPANLPLMQFALSELWQLRDGNRLTLQAYKQELGGITGALEKRANAVYAQFTDELDKRAVKHIFLSLTQLGEGTEDTRRRVVMSNLVTATLSLEAIERVVRKLADEKLVVTDDREKGKVSGDAIVDVAHEALIRGWRLLRGWLDEDRQNLRQQRWIEDRAIEWQGSGKIKEFLLSGRQLKDAGKFQQQQVDRFPLSELAEQLLKVSKSQQKKGWAFLAAVYMAIPITVAIVLGGLTIRWWYLETKWAVLRRCEKEQTEDGSCTGRLEALRVLIDANVSLPIDLSNANLRNADLSNANLSNATLLNTDLRLANLAYANLRNTNLNKTKLNNANLTKVNFSNAILIDSDLSNAILAYADLSGAKIIEVNLSNAILLNSDLSYAQISNTKMDRAMFLNANLDKSYLMNLSDISTIKEACNWEKASVLGKTEFKTQFEKVPDYLKNARECSQWENHPD